MYYPVFLYFIYHLWVHNIYIFSDMMHYLKHCFFNNDQRISKVQSNTLNPAHLTTFICCVNIGFLASRTKHCNKLLMTQFRYQTTKIISNWGIVHVNQNQYQIRAPVLATGECSYYNICKWGKINKFLFPFCIEVLLSLYVQDLCG